jgi:prenyltransferase beta subunit
VSLRLEMLQVARLAPKSLGESAQLIEGFLRRQHHASGGFVDRSGNPDLYYTVFGLEGLLALRADLPATAVAGYLNRFGDGAGLDFVHLACLARCWAALPLEMRTHVPTDAILAHVESYKSTDGGYAVTAGQTDGTLYGAFLALGTYQDLHRELPDPVGLLNSAKRLKADDGGYANQQDVLQGLTPSTAAAATLFRTLGEPIPPELAPWLLNRCRPDGGFFATPLAPLPDLLSTATALHSLVGMHADIEAIREPCLDFLDTLWTSQGGFHGHWADDILDSEYTYYGLLALGHLTA